MPLLNIAVCEDDPQEQQALLALLRQSSIPQGSCHVFSSGEALLADFCPGRYDLIFMDIYMKGMSGIDTVTAIRAQDAEVVVAFTTSSTEHALEGYRLNVLKYLEKPLTASCVEETLRLAVLQQDRRPCIQLRLDGQERTIPCRRILYVEQKNHTVLLYLAGGGLLQGTGRLDVLGAQFPMPPFFRCHKSYLVNLAQVRRLDRELGVFEMKEGANVHIRRESLHGAAEAYADYIFAQTRGMAHA